MLRIEQLHAAVGDKPLLKGFSLEVNAGEARAISFRTGLRPGTGALMLASLWLTPACSGQPTNDTARSRERCADVQKERARLRDSAMRRIREVQAEEERSDTYAENGLRNSAKFIALQHDIEAGERRLQIRLAECSGG